MVSRLTERTHKPGLVIKELGAGQMAYIPWDVGSLYYKYSNENHRLFVSDLIDHLIRGDRQLRTDAHPLVEMTLTRQPGSDQLLLHLVNLSGHTSTAFFPPLAIWRKSVVEVKGEYKQVYSHVLDKSLDISYADGYTRFMVPRLGAYDAISIQ